MKKILSIVFLCFAIMSLNIAYADEITDKNVDKTSEYYRQQVIVVQKYTKTNFMNAVYEGDTKLIEAYIKSGMNPDTTQMKLTPVMLAIGSKRSDSLEALLKNGANPELKVIGVTPLVFSINKKCYDCAKVLVDNNANVNSMCDGVTPIYAALAKKQYDIAELLINSGAVIDDDAIIKAVKSKNEKIKNLVLSAALKQANK